MVEKYKFEAHSFKGKIVGKTYCTKCGLVALNNRISRWCILMGCDSSIHPQYRTKLYESIELLS